MGYNQKHYCGILAVSPALFKSSGPLLRSISGQRQKGFSVTNKGLKTGSLVVSRPFAEPNFTHLLSLSCRDEDGLDRAVRLQMVSQNTYVRCNPFRLSFYDDRSVHGETGDCYVLVGNPPAAMGA